MTGVFLTVLTCSKLFKDPISKQQPQLIGDSRFSRVGARSETSRLRKHLFLAPKTICVVQHASLSNLLDPRYFARIDYNDFLFPVSHSFISTRV